jgi:asparagine synthetase B (glutamine-hydrolysing)
VRHGWVVAIASAPDAIIRRVSADRAITRRLLADGRTIVVATTPDVAVREHNGSLSIDPLPDVTIGAIDATTGRICARRTILSIPEVYWTCNASSILLGGSLADLLPHVDSPLRLDERSLIDHHLFSWVPGARTAVAGVSRLLPGHELQWRGKDSPTITQRQSLNDLASQERQPVGAAAAGLQVNALARAMMPYLQYTRAEDRAVLLSGGVDSSLLQMALETVDKGPFRQSRSYVIEDTPSWLGEEDYCREAVRILETQHEFTTISPRQYPDLLTASLRILGRPFGHESTPIMLGLFRALAARGPTTLWSGQGADAGYGMATGAAISRALRYARVPRPLLHALELALKPLWPMKAQRARYTASLLDGLRNETSPHHPANVQSRFGSDVETVVGWFGKRAVESAFTERRNLTALLATPISEIERVHFLDLFCQSLYTASGDFTLGAAAGCTVLQPYLDQEVIRAALRVDPEQRYYHCARTKPLLKMALEQRTGPEFVSRRKRAGTFYMDLYAWMRTGVLADMVRSIERPGYVDPGSFRQKIEAPDWTTWNLLLMDLYVKHLGLQASQLPDQAAR